MEFESGSMDAVGGSVLEVGAGGWVPNPVGNGGQALSKAWEGGSASGLTCESEGGVAGGGKCRRSR